MKTAIIIHGMPSKEKYYDATQTSESNSHWFPWLQRQLLLNHILAQTPEMPMPFRPSYESWKKVLEQFPLNEDAVLVGHSCGGGFLVRYLSENNIKVGKVALVAPWIDPEDSRPEPGFFDFKIDPNLASRTEDIKLFISSDDAQAELETAGLLEKEIKNLKIQRFSDRGHFTLSSMKTVEFPELLNYLINP